ncbi:MAG: recombinase family protein [Thermoplasmata archaeon]
MTERGVLYARVSTGSQDLNGQLRDLQLEAQRRGWEIVETYQEKVSGSGKVERQQYDRLLADAEKPDRPWTHLLVWALDRFSREERFTASVERVWQLERLGIRFHSLKEPILETPEDGGRSLPREIMLSLLPVLASWESKRRTERIRVAMTEIKAGRRPTRSGRPVGRPLRLIPEKVRRIVALRDVGKTWAEVAHSVSIPSETCRKAYRAQRAKPRSGENICPPSGAAP